MDVRKQRHAEIDHVAAQHLALARAVERDGERRGAGHRAHGGQVGGAVVAQDLPGASAGIGSGDQIQDRQPDVVAEHDDHDDLDEGGELVRDHALVAEVAEGRADIKRQQRDDHALDDLQHDILELLQQRTGGLAFRPDGGEAEEKRKGQRAHDRHDLRDIQLENDGGQLSQSFHVRDDGQMRDQRVAGGCAQKGRADRAEIGDHDGDKKHARGVAAHTGDRGSDKSDDDQRDAEGDQLAEDILDRNDDLHNALSEQAAEQDADGQRHDQAEGQAVEYLFHAEGLLFISGFCRARLLPRRCGASRPTSPPCPRSA